MTSQIHLYLIETDAERARSLAAELTLLPYVTVNGNYADAVEASGSLDAVFVPLMSALEWGAIKPPVPLYQTQVVKMPEREILRGRPKYAIPGVAISPHESMDPVSTTRLVLQESLKAIHRFNQVNQVKLKAIGVATVSLGFDKLCAGEASHLLSDAYLSLVA